MKAIPLPEIKKELKTLSTQEIEALCLRLARFKKENKELLTYLLFESHNESGYIETVKQYMDDEFDLINTDSYFYIRKSVRKILRNVKKFIRYSQKKETEVELLIYFCGKLKDFKPSINRSTQLFNMYNRQIALAKKTIDKLHEDLQYDYNLMLQEL
ncbi:hypothetical protein DIS18_09760 [Algibacter marinivivus]|uniref:Uncharacterized protein n=1 Tax=Algibacter marinivivus TaxID=2100723 RepID=A0A2U2X446_9FLAO|nr:hypothetical protein [Algibacter marinivivus]PWH82524.1 hypothetical protein DIS18_09760 [Algibacter marinivivus]